MLVSEAKKKDSSDLPPETKETAKKFASALGQDVDSKVEPIKAKKTGPRPGISTSSPASSPESTEGKKKRGRPSDSKPVTKDIKGEKITFIPKEAKLNLKTLLKKKTLNIQHKPEPSFIQDVDREAAKVKEKETKAKEKEAGLELKSKEKEAKKEFKTASQEHNRLSRAIYGQEKTKAMSRRHIGKDVLQAHKSLFAAAKNLSNILNVNSLTVKQVQLPAKKY